MMVNNDRINDNDLSVIVMTMVDHHDVMMMMIGKTIVKVFVYEVYNISSGKSTTIP